MKEKQFEEGLNSKVKLYMYKGFGKEGGICIGLEMQKHKCRSRSGWSGLSSGNTTLIIYSA